MIREDIQNFIDTTLALAPKDGMVETKEAEELAPKFILAKAAVAKYKFELELAKSRVEGESRILYKVALMEAKASNAVEKKAIAEADNMYISKVEELEGLEAYIYYLRSIEEVFFNLHIYYRTLGKYGLS